MSRQQSQCPKGLSVRARETPELRYRPSRSILLFISAVLTVLLTFQARAQNTEFWQFSSGDWVGGAYKDEKGRFSRCSIAATDTTGTLLAMAITADYDLQLVLAKPEWEFNKGEAYEIDLYVDYVDRKYLGRFTASAKQRSSLLIQVGNRIDVFWWLQNGYTLTVSAAQQDFRYSLKGTKHALAKVKECVDLAVALSPKSNPFAPASKNPFAPNRKSESEIDTAIIGALLAAAGLSDVELIDPKQVDIPKAQYAWKSGIVFGVMFSMVGSADKVNSMVIGEFVKDCDSTFGPQKTGGTWTGVFWIEKASAACRSGATNLYVVTTSVTSDSTTLVLMNIAEANPITLRNVNDNLADVLAVLLTE